MKALGRQSRAKAEEQRWRQFLTDPTLWWDNRSTKKNSNFPDFVHTSTGEALWMDSRFCPEWTPEKLKLLESHTPGRGVRARYKGEKPAKTSSRESLKAYKEMKKQGAAPSSSIAISALKYCSSSRELKIGKKIHSDLISSGNDSDLLVSTTLVDMYAKCGDMPSARKVFEKMQQRDSVSWNAIIMGYAHSGQGEEALELFRRMEEEGYSPVARTFIAVINACRALGWLQKGKEIHEQVSRLGLESDMFLANNLLDMYCKCGDMEAARELLERMPARDVVSWTCVISGYAQAEDGEQGLRCFSRMLEEDVKPDGQTYVAVFKACTALAVKERGELVRGKLTKSFSLEKAREIHSGIKCEMDIFMSNALIDLYAKCGSMQDAQRVFDRMNRRSVVSWTALILGYTQSGESENALNLFEAMKRGTSPNSLTYLSVLKACASMAAVELGRRIHSEIRKAGLDQEPAIINSLVSFYGKCGCMEDAKVVFDSSPVKDLVTWNALMAGYSYQGDVHLVLETFNRMLESKVSPDGITFISILTGCSHAGLVEKGKEYFEVMSSKYGISPGIDHYTCMVDLLGRGKQVQEALAMAKAMPCEADMSIWITILAACRKWGELRVAEEAFEALLKLDKRDAAAYVLMSSIYSSAGMNEESLRIEAMRREINAWKKPGQSWWVDPSGRVHKFVVGEAEHPQIAEIRAKLNEVHARMKEEGYVPHLKSISHDISDGEKEMALCEHSERLAIGCALLNTPPGTPIRIMKNLRICTDCHNATAILSRIEQRVVTCRDGSRFHVFMDGRCSCGDFW